MSLVIITHPGEGAQIDLTGDVTTVSAEVPRSFIDQHIGEEASGNQITQWFNERSDEVTEALETLKDGGTPSSPYDSLTLKEVR